MEFLRQALANDDDGRRAIRAIGGLLLATGFMVALFRRSGDLGEAWGPGGLFLLVAIPCAFLLGLGLAAYRASGETRPWQAVYVVFGLVLLPIALGELVNWVGEEGDAGNGLNVAWVFAATAAVGAYASLVARVRYCLLIAGLALIVAWLAFWDDVLSDGLTDVDTLRALLLAVAAFLLGVAYVLRTRRADAGLHVRGELVTPAGLAAVVATIGLSVSGSGEALAASIFYGGAPGGEASPFWETAGLVVALGLIGYGARLGMRGPAYVGAIGLVLFMIVVGLDLDDDSPEGSLLGWALLLSVIGAGAVIASLLPSVKPGSLGLDRLVPEGSQAPAPAATPPPAAPPPPASPPPQPPSPPSAPPPTGGP